MRRDETVKMTIRVSHKARSLLEAWARDYGSTMASEMNRAVLLRAQREERAQRQQQHEEAVA
jgi:hypothetical protein